MRFRTLLILSALALALGAYIVLVDQGLTGTDEKERTQAQLFRIHADDLDWIRISSAKGTLVFKKTEQRWRIVNPVEAEVDFVVFHQILNQLEFGSETGSVDAEMFTSPAHMAEQLRKFGLEPPEITVEFRAAETNGLLMIGRQAAQTQNAYARTSRDSKAPVRLVSMITREAFDVGLNDARSKVVIDRPPEAIRRVMVRASQQGSPEAREGELIADDKGEWSLIKPVSARANRKRSDLWVRQLTRLLAAGFAPEDIPQATPAAIGLGRYQMTVNPGMPGEITVAIGEPAKEKPGYVYARRLDNPAVFYLNENEVQKLLTGFEDLRERRLLAVEPSQLRRIRMQRESATDVFDAERTELDWRVRPGDLRGNPTAIFDLAHVLTSASVSSFAKDAASDLAPFGLAKPSARVNMEFDSKPGDPSGPPEKAAIEFGNLTKNGTEVYVRTTGAPFVVTVPRGIFDLLPADALALRHLQAMQANPDTVTELEVAADGSVTKLFRDANGVFTTDFPGMAVDSVRAQAQVAVLARLHGRRWLGPARPEYGFDKPKRKFQLRGPDTIPAIVVGAELPTGGRAAIIEGTDLAFEISPEDYQMISQRPLVPSP
jgi:hypothetical protein